MTFRFSVLIAAAGSAALLLGALGFQFIGGLAPCHLCLLQRWPHLAAIAIGALAIATQQRIFALFGALAAAITAGIGIYHTGVERGIFEGPTTCTSGPPGSLSSEQLFDKIMNAPLIRCDEVAWQMLGLSMASWNAIIPAGECAQPIGAVRAEGSERRAAGRGGACRAQYQPAVPAHPDAAPAGHGACRHQLAGDRRFRRT
jgi:disulfide bond formation protein DsbB